MNFRIFGLVGALLLAAPVAAVAAPATGLTAHGYSDLATAPQAANDVATPGAATPKLEKVWWRGRGWGWRGRGWRGGWGYRRGWGFYGWRRPYWRRRYWVY